MGYPQIGVAGLNPVSGKAFQGVFVDGFRRAEGTKPLRSPGWTVYGYSFSVEVPVVKKSGEIGM
jgi:hypothetical protein